MVSCCSGGLAVRRAAAWSYVLGVKEDACGQAYNPSIVEKISVVLKLSVAEFLERCLALLLQTLDPR
jgi:hypothetical protein